MHIGRAQLPAPLYDRQSSYHFFFPVLALKPAPSKYNQLSFFPNPLTLWSFQHLLCNTLFFSPLQGTVILEGETIQEPKAKTQGRDILCSVEHSKCCASSEPGPWAQAGAQPRAESLWWRTAIAVKAWSRSNEWGAQVEGKVGLWGLRNGSQY